MIDGKNPFIPAPAQQKLDPQIDCRDSKEGLKGWS